MTDEEKAERHKARCKAYHLANREKVIARRRKHREDNYEKVREQEKASKARRPEQVRESNRKWVAANKERKLATDRAWREKNKEARKAYMEKYGRDWYAKNKERKLAVGSAYYYATREIRNAKQSEWAKANKGKRNASGAKYRASKRTSTPAWVDQFEIECIYKLCAAYRAIGLDMHVDHIVPLLGKTVCGLHTPDNLQIIHAKDNISKSNRKWPDMP